MTNFNDKNNLPNLTILRLFHLIRNKTLQLSLFLLGIGLLICIVFNPLEGINLESVTIPLDNNRNLVAKIYTPKNIPAPYPTIILCHGINASKEMIAPLAIEIARHGIAAIAFDFGGFGESYPLPDKSVQTLEASTLADAQAILAFLRSQPQRFDAQNLGIGGHSLGGTTSLQLAQINSELHATVVLSMSGFATSKTPQNLFLGVGLYEQLNPPQDLREMLAQATEGKCLESGKICGNFVTGNGRKLFISDTTDHFTAPYDPQLIREVISWLQQAFHLPVRDKFLIYPWFILGFLLTFSGIIATGVSLIFRSTHSIRINYPKFYGLFRYGITGSITLLILFAYQLKESNILLCFYLMQLCTNYTILHPKRVSKAVGIATLYNILFLIAFLLPGLLIGAREIIHNPAHLFRLPQFLLQWPIFLVFNYTIFFKNLFFQAYTLKIQLSWLAWLLIGLELIKPGITLTWIAKIGVRSVKGLRSPLALTKLGKLNAKNSSLLAGLVVLLTVILHQQSVYLERVWSTGIAGLQVFGLLLFLPISIIIIILRSRWFQTLEIAVDS